jgi:hypothetical protein
VTKQSLSENEIASLRCSETKLSDPCLRPRAQALPGRGMTAAPQAHCRPRQSLGRRKMTERVVSPATLSARTMEDSQ